MFEIFCDCGLYAIVAGGKDRAGISFIQTIWCAKCKVIQDIVTATEEAESGEITSHSVCCEICGTPDVVVWNVGLPCPDCGGRVIVNAGGDAVVSPE